MKKRLTKQQQIEEQRKLLQARVKDVVTGACGEVPDGDFFTTAEQLSRIVPALKGIFPDDSNSFMWMPHNLCHFENVETITEFLFSNGERA
jgi:hypothetical protein